MKRQNILIQGIAESPCEKNKQDVTELLKLLGINFNSSIVTSIYRIGAKPKNQSRPRQIKLKLSSALSKQELFKNITLKMGTYRYQR